MARKKGSLIVELARKASDGRYKDPHKGLKAKQMRAWEKK